MEPQPHIGISLSTHMPTGPEDSLSYVLACVEAACGADVKTILLAARHGETAKLQPGTIVPVIVDRAPGTTVAPIFIAPVWPTALLIEHIASLATIARRAGATVTPVLASGRNEPVAATPMNPTADRGRAVELALNALLDADANPWIAAERGPALSRARRASGWVSNAIYNQIELEAQLSVVRDVPVRAVRRDVLCRPDGELARREARELLSRGYRADMKSEHVIAGDPIECAKQIEDYRGLGFTHVLIRPMTRDPGEAASTIASVVGAANSS